MTEQDIPKIEKADPDELWPNESPVLDVSSFETPPEEPFEVPFVPVAYTPEPTEETVRKGGLAWSAGIVFFGSVAFMLFLGWLADVILGSSPWGIVAGIILGSTIGFIQFFRISSQIYSKTTTKPEDRPLLSRDDEL